MIEVGDKAPIFSLKDQDNNDFSIEQFIGEKPIVIFFYPKDFTPGCVREVCSFRDQYQDFQDKGVEVIGISSDGHKSHEKFAKKHNLPFTLLSDVKGKVRKQFGVPSSLFGLLPGRMTFVIDAKGIVIMRFNNQFGAEKHIVESLKILNEDMLLSLNYPIKFEPILKEKIWGGEKLMNLLNKKSNKKNIGESWEISDVKGDTSIVSNGIYKGRNLKELISEFKGDLVGNKVYKKFGNEFPLLIKFIDAKESLSIQLHPDDKLAKKRHNSFGKTEMWYVMQADEESSLIIGFKDGITSEKYLDHLNNKSLVDILNFDKVIRGDIYEVTSGLIHSIGAGVMLAEIQQTSDITYRVYDWDRVDSDGNFRDLHTKEAIDAIDYSSLDDYKTHYSTKENISNTVVDCPYFTTNLLPIHGNVHVNHTDKDSFVIYMCVKGSVEIFDKAKKEMVKINCGETVLIPSLINDLILNSENKSELLEVYIK